MSLHPADAEAREVTEAKKPASGRAQILPDFIAKGDKVDKILLSCFLGISIFHLALLPFRAILLTQAPLLSVFLTGGSFSTIAVAVQHRDNYIVLVLLAVLSALSSVKFLPLYYFMGKRWGAGFLDLIFKSHKPFWFRKFEGFIFKYPALSLGLSYVPFCPLSPALIVAISGITRVKGKKIVGFVLFYALLLKSCYITLSIIFGEVVIEVLQIIDKYTLWITFALLAWVMFVSFRSELKNPANKSESTNAVCKK